MSTEGQTDRWSWHFWYCLFWNSWHWWVPLSPPIIAYIVVPCIKFLMGGSHDTFLSDCVMLLTQLMKVCGFFFNVDCKITLTFNTTYFSKTFHYLLQHVAVSILNMMKLKIFIKIFQMLNLSNLWLFMCWSMLLSPKFINSFTNEMYPYYFITKYYVP